MAKKVIRLTENDLHRIVKESVNRILKEEELPGFNDPHGLVSSINDMSPETFENQEIFEVAAEDAIRRLKDCGQEISLMNVIDEMGLKDIIEKAIKDYYPSDINPRVYYNR